MITEELGQANGARYVLALSSENWMMELPGVFMQVRYYWVNHKFLMVRPNDGVVGTYRMTSDELFLHMNTTPPLRNDMRFNEKVQFFKEKWTFPGDWLPGICDEWMQRHAFPAHTSVSAAATLATDLVKKADSVAY
jgi:hypothetical protein